MSEYGFYEDNLDDVVNEWANLTRHSYFWYKTTEFCPKTFLQVDQRVFRYKKADEGEIELDPVKDLEPLYHPAVLIAEIKVNLEVLEDASDKLLEGICRCSTLLG